MKRSRILVAASFCLSAVSAFGAETPNILLVLVDDMGYGDCRIYNPQSQVPMPNLESLAERGMVFTDAHSAAATCAPSRYSMLTGNYPWRGRKPGGTWRYNEPCQILDHQETLGTLLKKAGSAPPSLCGPLSLEKTTRVFSSRPSAFKQSKIRPTSRSSLDTMAAKAARGVSWEP